MINYIEKDKCTGCGTCTKSCSLDVFRLDTKQDTISPCMSACPAGIDIRGYNALIQEGRLEEAYNKLCQSNPFPSITGRICFHPCESECARNFVDEAVNINALEQFLGDLKFPDETPCNKGAMKVAIIGSGPAGLSCAYSMAKMGYVVTVFESAPRPGGMLRYGIPAYRLPDEVIDADIERLKSLGVAFRCNTKIGDNADISIETLRRRGYKAFFLAPGSNLSRKLSLKGIDFPNVLWGVEFLRAIRSDFPMQLSGKVVVVGGGDVAIDTAISAKKLGAETVTIVSLESEVELPAYPHNIVDAQREGILFQCSLGPVAVEGDKEATGLTVKKCTSVKDANNNFSPCFDECQTQTLDADTIIFAIGQMSDLAPFAKDVEITNKNTIDTKEITFATSNKDIFAAGDAVTGPASAIQAIAGGREAANSMNRYLRGSEILANRAEKREVVAKDKLPKEGVLLAARNNRKIVDSPDFSEHQQGFDLHCALAEGMRCMTCGAKAYIAYNDDCMTCFTCELRCPSEAINVHPFKEILPRTLEINCED